MQYDAGSVKLLHFHIQFLAPGVTGRCYSFVLILLSPKSLSHKALGAAAQRCLPQSAHCMSQQFGESWQRLSPLTWWLCSVHTWALWYHLPNINWAPTYVTHFTNSKGKKRGCMGQKLNYAPLEVPQLQIMYVPTSQSIYPGIKTVAHRMLFDWNWRKREEGKAELSMLLLFQSFVVRCIHI